jgi:hypothetical protein
MVKPSKASETLPEALFLFCECFSLSSETILGMLQCSGVPNCKAKDAEVHSSPLGMVKAN